MTFQLVSGDCLDALSEMEEASVDAVVTDPPYGLEFMGKEWDSFRRDDPGTKRHRGKNAGKQGELVAADERSDRRATVGYGGGKRPNTYRCVGCGKRDQFRNDHDCPPDTEWRRELIDPFAAPPTMLAFQEWTRQWSLQVLRVLKPGGHLLAFGGTRTYHRLASGIEDAGFEVRDCLAWMYGSGFPKSLDVSKAIDKAAGAERQVVRTPITPGSTAGKGFANEQDERPWMTEARQKGYHEHAGTTPATEAARQWQGWGTALKPAFEPIILARKPLTGTVAANVQEFGTGALNVDGCRVGTDGGTTRSGESDRLSPQGAFTTGHQVAAIESGRWPANVILDGAGVPVVSMKYNLPYGTEQAIREYFCGYHLPDLRSPSSRSSESGRSEEVLRQGVLSAESNDQDRGTVGEVRGASYGGGKEENVAGAETTGKDRQRSIELEGRPLQDARLRDGQTGAGRSRVSGDGSRQTKIRGGASSSDGEEDRPTAEIRRGGSSHKRDQGRQPPGESRTPYSGNAQAQASRDLSGTPGATGGERTPESTGRLVVLASDVPPPWWHYFDETGGEGPSAGAMLDEQTGETKSTGGSGETSGLLDGTVYGHFSGENKGRNAGGLGDTGGASRFFYTAKASRAERNAGLDGLPGKQVGAKGNGLARTCATCGASVLDGCDCPDRTFENPTRANHHPTVKPIDLMRYLVRLVTPPDGTVLDPFTGSGTTGIAAGLEGFDFVGIEREAEYREIAEARLKWWADQEGETAEILRKAGLAEKEREQHEQAGQASLFEDAA